MSTFVLQLPNSFVDIDCEEMEYVFGGATSDLYYSAKQASTYLAGLATSWIALATGYGYASASGLVTAGIGTLIGIVGGGYSGVMAALYVGAYTDAEEIRADYGDSARVRIRTITLLGAITKVTVTRV